MKINSYLILGLIAIGGGLIPAAVHAEGRKPNVIVIVADDLGWGELGIQGNPQIPTPNIDSIGRNGVRFTSGYVSGTYCSPTRAGLMTGKYQQRFGHEFNSGPVQTASTTFGLPLEEKTAGDRFKEAGYATGWFGKSHLGFEPAYHPLKRGFDEFYGFLGGAHSYTEVGGKNKESILRGYEPVDTIDYATDAFAREATAFIEKHKGTPYFVYLPFNAMHSPLNAAPQKYIDRFPNITDPKRQQFAAGLSALDDAVGSVLTKVRELGQEENTLIFFFNDNGGPTAQTTSSNGPLRGFKAQTYEGGVRIAWLAQWKSHIPAGQVDDRPVIQLDILPTALAAAGVEVKPEWKFDGVNLLPYVTGQKKEAPHEALFWRFGQQVAIRKGDWKLVKGPDEIQGKGSGNKANDQTIVKATIEGAKLYNLAQDIGESKNLASSEPEKVKELAAAWNAWNAHNIEPKWVGGARKPANGNGAGGKKNQKKQDQPAATSASAQ